ncbi:hypothetical protein predicted by Glimmer/Critica [Acetobacter ghanensis]|uniref:Uncharacterized protein n=1 Tax=Acetobacter ghanensis TaxID=431306 RepID=A0A0U5F4N8_9PROT|nr:hypothetical protein predicted by Glimmer/Critica [Acetobacter ghanensis]
MGSKNNLKIYLCFVENFSDLSVLLRRPTEPLVDAGLLHLPYVPT